MSAGKRKERPVTKEQREGLCFVKTVGRGENHDVHLNILFLKKSLLLCIFGGGGGGGGVSGPQ